MSISCRPQGFHPAQEPGAPLCRTRKGVQRFEACSQVTLLLLTLPTLLCAAQLCFGDGARSSVIRGAREANALLSNLYF